LSADTDATDILRQWRHLNGEEIKVLFI